VFLFLLELKILDCFRSIHLLNISQRPLKKHTDAKADSGAQISKIAYVDV